MIAFGLFQLEVLGCFPVLIIGAIIFGLSSIKIVNEYERGILFTLGQFTKVMEPGLNFVIPIYQSWRRVDIRVLAVDVPRQDTMTKDNVSVVINAVLYFRVADPKLAALEVQNYDYATSQIAQTTMRNVVGQISLDELLSQRESTSKRIQEIVDAATDPWGIKVESVELKDIELPPDLIRVIGKAAEAEREKRAVIIKAEGELEASKSFVKAAKRLSSAKGSLHIRTLQTINNLANEKSNTRLHVIPSELLKQVIEFLKTK
jgi:regulator of protease activity HflC (stomatin/prohibitin superfamily)